MIRGRKSQLTSFLFLSSPSDSSSSYLEAITTGLRLLCDLSRIKFSLPLSPTSALLTDASQTSLPSRRCEAMRRSEGVSPTREVRRIDSGRRRRRPQVISESRRFFTRIVPQSSLGFPPSIKILVSLCKQCDRNESHLFTVRSDTVLLVLYGLHVFSTRSLRLHPLEAQAPTTGGHEIDPRG